MGCATCGGGKAKLPNENKIKAKPFIINGVKDKKESIVSQLKK